MRSNVAAPGWLRDVVSPRSGLVPNFFKEEWNMAKAKKAAKKPAKKKATKKKAKKK
jgi:hypothetical protein